MISDFENNPKPSKFHSATLSKTDALWGTLSTEPLSTVVCVCVLVCDNSSVSSQADQQILSPHVVVIRRSLSGMTVPMLMTLECHLIHYREFPGTGETVRCDATRPPHGPLTAPSRPAVTRERFHMGRGDTSGWTMDAGCPLVARQRAHNLCAHNWHWLSPCQRLPVVHWERTCRQRKVVGFIYPPNSVDSSRSLYATAECLFTR
ncbi:hypothetical protein EGW08_014882 [Elysia chlorotica]|uniref:Uncharacterized protein n=1 Tax=Elysia chlorotica TaxID=188477 RepID=A0A3S1HDU3_ELYCH|nr:hypothetical protein EGW08_014882 [Elysia chlorotica]